MHAYPAPDLLVVGGGIIGAATAYKWRQLHPNDRILLIEKETTPAQHQTGRNSNVVHSGIYYQPGSLKALLCRTGRLQLKQFCLTHDLPWKQTGKLIVAQNLPEAKILEQLQQRAIENGLREPAYLTQSKLKGMEPEIQGSAGILVHETALVDYGRITKTLLKAANAEIQTGVKVLQLRPTNDLVEVLTTHQLLFARQVVTCAGLTTVELLPAAVREQFRILPFRGEYYYLDPAIAQNITRPIYPVPDANYPFLGVHLTPTSNHQIKVGPNAVPAGGLEFYTRGACQWGAFLNSLRFPGTKTFFTQHWRKGLQELLAAKCKSLYLKQVRRLVPRTKAGDLTPGPCGIRAQAVHVSGKLVDDFVFHQVGSLLYTINAPSPAATAALAIADHIIERTCLS